MTDEATTDATMPLNVDSDGGGGACTISERKDAALIRRAIKERWPMDDETRESIVSNMRAVVSSSEDVRARVHAAKVLIEADKLNMEQEKREQGIPDRLELTGNAAQPGNVTVNVFNRIDAYAESFVRAAGGTGQSNLPSHSSGKPLDTGEHQSGDDSKAG